jgi:hypothetical protein
VDGEPIENATVYLSYPFTWQESETDSDGWASFERDSTAHGGIRTDVRINGSLVAEQEWFEDGNTRSYSIQREDS